MKGLLEQGTTKSERDAITRARKWDGSNCVQTLQYVDTTKTVS